MRRMCCSTATMMCSRLIRWIFGRMIPSAPAIKELEGGRKIITGRGTADDKGQLLTFVRSLPRLQETVGALPVKISILFEGEEESGSPSLKPFLEPMPRS